MDGAPELFVRALVGLAAGYGAEDDEGFGAADDGGGEGRVDGVVGEVLLAGEEAQEGAALEGDVVADSAAEHGVGGFEGVESGADGGWGGDFDLYFVAGDAGQGAEVGREFDADGGHLRDKNRSRFPCMFRFEA